MLVPVVVLDACVLYPAALRDLLLRLSVHEVIHAKWSNQIHEEWINAVLRQRPDLRKAQLEWTRKLMDLHAGDCLVEGFEKHIGKLDLPDKNDRHVLAAAVECKADAIISLNLRDFPKPAHKKHRIEVLTPDQLVMRRLGFCHDEIMAVLDEHRRSLRHPPKTVREYFCALEQQGLRRTVELLNEGREIV